LLLCYIGVPIVKGTWEETVGLFQTDNKETTPVITSQSDSTFNVSAITFGSIVQTPQLKPAPLSSCRPRKLYFSVLFHLEVNLFSVLPHRQKKLLLVISRTFLLLLL